MSNNLDVFFEARAVLGEGPIWHERLDELHFVDIDRGAIRRVSAEAKDMGEVLVGESVGCAVPTRDGDCWVVGTRSGVSLVSQKGDVQHHIDIDAERGHHRMNDGSCDARGRLWTGSLNESPSAPSDMVYRVDPDWTVTTIVTEVALSNGLGWSPDSRTMYRVDSGRRLIFAADFDLEVGRISAEQVVIDLSSSEAEPDGLVVDVEGGIWVALWNGWAIHRYSPSGRLLTVVGVPVARPTSVAFGGSDYSTLFVTSASKGLTAQERQRQPHAGDIFAATVGVAGLPAHYFGS